MHISTTNTTLEQLVESRQFSSHKICDLEPFDHDSRKAN
jgi:hypothetical protein